MAVRMEVELTSSRPDGTWTWRAAGARQPKGELDGGLLYAGAKVGDVVRVDADVQLEGITISLVLPPKAARTEPARLELITPPAEGRVTTSLTGRRPSDDRRRDRGERGPRDDRRPRRDGPRRDDGAGRGGVKQGDRPRGGAGPADARPARPPRERRPPAPAAERPEPAPKPKRLQIGHKHRQGLLAGLGPEQVPVAEQLIKGGISAVRAAIDTQNETAAADGRPELPAAPLLAIAEDLLPQVRAAEWHDRADAAIAAGDDVGLRDLRALVAAADASARDDETRALAAQLRQVLEQRRAAAREQWITELGSALDEARVLRALRLSARGPEPGSRLPIELARRLTDAANEAVAGEVSEERKAALADAIAHSPIKSAGQPPPPPKSAAAPKPIPPPPEKPEPTDG